jgi:hypothetical protein
MPDELVGELEELVLEAVAVVEDILRSLWLLESYRDMGRVSTSAGEVAWGHECASDKRAPSRNQYR